MKSDLALKIAHRGAAKYLPENTLPAFLAAFEEYGAEGIEFDVKLSKDGVPVIFHDDCLERVTNGRGLVSNYTLEELQKLDAAYWFDPEEKCRYALRGKGFQIPTLESLFRALGSRLYCVEIKDPVPGLVDKIVLLAESYGVLERCIMGSFHDVIFRKLRKTYPHVPAFLSRRRVLMLLLEYSWNRSRPKKEPNLVASLPVTSPLFTFNHRHWIEFLHRKGIRVFFWTINQPELMKELAENGADGLMSDDPGLLRDTLT